MRGYKEFWFDVEYDADGKMTAAEIHTKKPSWNDSDYHVIEYKSFMEESRKSEMYLNVLLELSLYLKTCHTTPLVKQDIHKILNKAGL